MKIKPNELWMDLWEFKRFNETLQFALMHAKTIDLSISITPEQAQFFINPRQACLYTSALYYFNLINHLSPSPATEKLRNFIDELLSIKADVFKKINNKNECFNIKLPKLVDDYIDTVLRNKLQLHSSFCYHQLTVLHQQLTQLLMIHNHPEVCEETVLDRTGLDPKALLASLQQTLQTIVADLIEVKALNLFPNSYFTSKEVSNLYYKNLYKLDTPNSLRSYAGYVNQLLTSLQAIAIKLPILFDSSAAQESLSGLIVPMWLTTKILTDTKTFLLSSFSPFIHKTIETHPNGQHFFFLGNKYKGFTVQFYNTQIFALNYSIAKQHYTLEKNIRYQLFLNQIFGSTRSWPTLKHFIQVLEKAGYRNGLEEIIREQELDNNGKVSYRVKQVAPRLARKSAHFFTCAPLDTLALNERFNPTYELKPSNGPS